MSRNRRTQARLAVLAAAAGGLAARYEQRFRELMGRLEAEPGVVDVTFSSRPVGATLPGRIEVEGVPMPAESPSGHSSRYNRVDIGLFDAFDVPNLAGRGFRSGDPGAASNPVIVNRAFVERVFGGGNALGRRFRYVSRYDSSGPRLDRWYQIVGIVGNELAVAVDPGESVARTYHPVTPGQIQPAVLAVRTRGVSAAEFAPRLREVALAVDPAVQVRDAIPLDTFLQRKLRILRLTGFAIAFVVLSVILLSAAGIHSMISFTVSRRRKEIGIRAALGAPPARLLAGIYARAATQITMGLAVGIAAAIWIDRVVENIMGGHGSVVVPAAAAFMLVVGLLAALGPTRRGLRIQPTEALRAE